jgi:hypothetical protein
MMSGENVLRQEIRHSLNDVRGRIRSYSGLYPDESLIREVLRACDAMTAEVEADPRVEEARRNVAERCQRLAAVADRFSNRDPVVIAASRAQAIAAIDMLQDAVFELRRARSLAPQLRGILRRKSL